MKLICSWKSKKQKSLLILIQTHGPYHKQW